MNRNGVIGEADATRHATTHLHTHSPIDVSLLYARSEAPRTRSRAPPSASTCASRRSTSPPCTSDSWSRLVSRTQKGPSQLVAEALVLEHVQYGVALVAVQRDPAPWTFVQGRAVFRLDLARRVLALSDLSLSVLRSFGEIGDSFLSSE